MKILSGVATVVGAWLAYAVVENRQYHRSVRTAAEAENIDYDALAMPAHWPFELYAGDLTEVGHPEQAERIVGSASSSVDYYIVPVGGVDSAVVIVFSFSLGWRTNTISVTIPKVAPTSVDGSDFLPSGNPVQRDAAVSWFESRSPP